MTNQDKALHISTHLSANTELMDVCSRQHRHIMDAIVIGDEIGAEKYAKEHISYIKKNDYLFSF